MSFKTFVLLLCLTSPYLVVGKPQISFGEEETVPAPAVAEEVKPVEETVVEPITSGDEELDNELIQTRLGLLAGYLSKLLFNYLFYGKII